MPKLPGVNHLDAVLALEKAGFQIVRQGKHVVMSNGQRILTIPRHNPVNAFTMGGIARDAGLSIEQLYAQLYMQSAFGQLARFCMLDDRQYRSHQVCVRPGRGGSTVVKAAECAERLSPELTLLGTEQERWLNGALEKSTAGWNIIAQQTLMAQHTRGTEAEPGYWTDGWDGYPKARERLLTHIAQHRISNPLVLGGDVHTGIVADLKLNFDDPQSLVVATEFVGTSITSQGPNEKSTEASRQRNPHLKFSNGTQRGYTAFDVTPTRCTVRMRTLSQVTDPQATISDLASFVVESGKAGARKL